MTVQRHPRPGVDQSGHSDIHHEGAAHPPQDVEAHQPSDRHHRDYDHDAEYRLQLISTFPSVRLLHITRDEPRRIRVQQEPRSDVAKDQVENWKEELPWPGVPRC